MSTLIYPVQYTSQKILNNLKIYVQSVHIFYFEIYLNYSV